MSVPFSNTKLRVPNGFQNILEGLAREVLRSQPKDIFEFGTHYFEKLLRVREETGHDPAIHGAQLQDRFFNNDSFSNVSFEQSAPDKQEAATKIQTQYRQHAATKEVGAMREEEAAIKIQAGVRGYIDRQRVLEKKDPEEYARRQKEIERRMSGKEYGIDFNDPDVENAAVKIQAGFKGYKARKETHEKQASHKDEHDGKTEKPDEAPKDEEVDIDLNDPDVEKAATKIQASFKGYKARKEVQHIKDQDQPGESETTAEAPAEEAVTGETDDKTKEEEIDIDLNDPEVEKAAIKIQSGFKGYKVRQGMNKNETDEKTEDGTVQDDEKKEEGDDEKKEGETEEGAEGETKEGEKKGEEVDIDLNDPEVEQAAIKIQAGFKGFKARKDIQHAKEEKPTEETTEEKPADDEAGDQ